MNVYNLEILYAVGATYKGESNDNVADHRALYLSLFGEDFSSLIQHIPAPNVGTKVRCILV